MQRSIIDEEGGPPLLLPLSEFVSPLSPVLLLSAVVELLWSSEDDDEL